MKFIASFLSLLFSCALFSQGDVQLNNPSFEDVPHAGKNSYDKIRGWYNCGSVLFPNESPPDIHPTADGWKVEMTASHGNTFLGMVTRSSETWESIAQRINTPLKQGVCYSFSIEVAKSDKYVSQLRNSAQYENFDRPTVLRIWGGNSYCAKADLLAETDPVDGQSWKIESFKIQPNENCSFIMLEAFYKTPTLFPYNGHVLVDNASAFEVIPCDEKEDALAAAPPSKPKRLTPKQIEKSQKKKESVSKPAVVQRPPVNTQIPESKTQNTSAPQDVVETTNEKLLVELDRDRIKKNQTILVKNLFFDADDSTIKEESQPVLHEIYDFLDENGDIIIEIAGHTNGNHGISNEYCDNLSSLRAEAVAVYLVEQGIDADRVYYKGYGKRKPVATNLTAEGRKQNQRVEIKILSIQSK